MARVLYIDPDPASETRSQQLGCGWLPTTPAECPDAQPPCVVLIGAGRCEILPDDGTLTEQAVLDALAPILETEAAAQVDAPSPIVVSGDALDSLKAQVSKATTVAAVRNALLNVLETLTPASDS